MKRRVAVTGMGVISPLGIGIDENWAALCNGKSGIAPITKFDTNSFPIEIAGEVRDFDPQQYIGHKEVKKMDIFIHYAVAASQLALKDSGFEISE
ncbi:MAG: beta-ketoacyl synthase N-terminal-like domain-containing protein, partial [Nitrospinaceae bacterium]|nr:beta-ketoacyl synthase N-terminal-like domain-containing protein [Nitrospinaceae bacterium]